MNQHRASASPRKSSVRVTYQIFYTLDGTNPTPESIEYTGPFNITETTTVKAMYVRNGAPSEIAEVTFTKADINKPAAPTIFAWGEIEGKDNYEWATYKHGTSYNQLTKYVSSVGYGLDGFIDNKEVLDESDDAAAQLLGNGWRMPTPEEMQELIEDCTWEEDYDMGVGGLRVTGPNGNSIFMPFAGRMYGSILFQSNASGYYWTSSLNEKANVQAKYLCIAPNGQEVTCYNRYFGFSIRPVKK